MSQDIGLNRTGIGMSPLDGTATTNMARDASPDLPGDAHQMAEVRESYAREAPPLGTLPPPTTLRGLGATFLEALKGRSAPALIDRLGQRLAFERTGARLYEALIVKLDATGTWEGGPTHALLRQFREDEVRHAVLVAEALISLGADPTAQTPAADVSAVVALGVVQIIVDPRTDLAQALDAMLVAELADGAGWETLVDLAEEYGLDELRQQCLAAQLAEAQHLRHIKSWLAANLQKQVRGLSLDDATH